MQHPGGVFAHSGQYNIIDYVTNPNGKGSYGRFKLRAVLAPKTAKVKVANDSRAAVTVQGAVKDTDADNSGAFTTYKCSRGDMLTYTVNNVKSGYDWNQIRIHRVASSLADTTVFREKGKNVAYAQVDSAESEITPMITDTENKMTVKVRRSLYDSGQTFDKGSSIFKNLSYSDSTYHYFLIDRGAGVTGHDYSLSVKVKPAGAVPKWSIEKNSGTYYCQDEFYYQATETPSDNVIILDICKSSELSDVVITGFVHYRDVSLANTDTSGGWVPADGAYIVPNSQAVAVVDDKGSFTTSPFRAKIGTWARCRLYSNGNMRYVDVKFTNQKSAEFEKIGTDGKKTTVRAYISDMKDIIVNPQGTDRPHIASVICSHTVGPQVRDEILIGEELLTDITASVAIIDPVTGGNFRYTFTDSSGMDRVREENVTNVQFMVVDPVTREIKSTFEAVQDGVDKNIWSYGQSFVTGEYVHYQAGDVLYARIVTDRVPDNFDTKNDTALPYYYGMVNTGIYFREEGQKAPKAPLDIDFSRPGADSNHLSLTGGMDAASGGEDFGVMTLPYIGKLQSLFTAKGMVFGIEKLANGGIRFQFGKAFKGIANHFGPDGKPLGDRSFKYDLNQALQLSEDMKNIDKQYGTHEALKPIGVGVPVWSIKPIAGIYIDFAPSYDPKGVKRLAFAGGGGFVGAIGDIRYTYYMIVYGIPFYVGGGAHMLVLTEFGLAQSEGNELIYTDIDQDALNKIIDGTKFNFVIRDSISVSAYAGVGICGTVGVRGGFVLSIDMIYSPFIHRIHPQLREWGMSVKGSINIWIDLVLLTVPIPVYSWDFLKTGYYEDLANENAAPKKNLLSASGDDNSGENKLPELTVRKKPRKEGNSDFKGDDAAFRLRASLSGDKEMGVPPEDLIGAPADEIRKTQHVSYSTEENVIIDNSYDNTQQKLINYKDASGSDKILMLYIDDDAERSDEDRTALKYSVYDIRNKTWSTPEYVCDDKTADFAPDVYDTGDKIAIAWTSRKTPLTGADEDDYSRMLSSMDIFFTEFDKSSETIAAATPSQLTDNSYYNTTPKIMYDKYTGEMLVTYMVSNVPSQFDTVDELLKTANPQRNDCHIMYKIRHSDGTWENSTFYAGELRTGASEKLMLSLFDGARFLKSPVSAGMQNTIIADLDVTVADMKPASGSGAVVPTGIFAYSVDMDNNLDTSADKEIFIQTYDFDSHTAGNPVRLTDNDIADTLPQIARCDGNDALFWLQDGNRIKRFDLTELAVQQEEGEFHIFSSGINITSDIDDDTEINAFRVYAQKSDTCENSFNYYIAWNENSDLIGEDVKGDYAQELHVAAYVPEPVRASDSAAGYVPRGQWSDGVRVTNNQKLNDIPEFASLEDDENGVMMVGSRYCLYSDADGESGASGIYHTEESQLVSMQYRPMGLLTLESADIDRLPEKAGDEFDVKLRIRNTGLGTVSGFAYISQLWAADDITPLDAQGGAYEGDILPGGTADLLLHATASETPSGKIQDNVLVFVTLDSGSASVNEHVFAANRIAELADMNAKQDGDVFRIKGTVNNTTPEALGADRRLVIFPNGNYSRKLYDRPVSLAAGGAIESGDKGDISLTVQVDPELIPYGIQDMAAVIVDDEDEAYSDYETFTGAIEYPALITVNGRKDGGIIRIKKGESITLTGDYEPKSYYRNAELIFSTEDRNIAAAGDGALTGVSEGITTLHATANPFGGDTEIKVIVSDSSSPEPEPDPVYPRSHSSSSGAYTPVRHGPASARYMTGKWVLNADNTWSYIKHDGSNFTGWGYTLSGSNRQYYHLGEDGRLDAGWYYDQEAQTWYYLNEQWGDTYGLMCRGWYKDEKDGNWYYLSDDDGSIKDGWHQIMYKGKLTWFYFNRIHNGYFGACQLGGRTPDGYTLNPDGSWTGF